MSVNGCTPQKASSTMHLGAVTVRERIDSGVSATNTPATMSYASSREDFHLHSLRNAGHRAPLDRMFAVTELVRKHFCLALSRFYPQLCRRRSFDGSAVVYGHLCGPNRNRCCSLLCSRDDDSEGSHLGHQPSMVPHSTTLEVLTLDHGLLVADSAFVNACQAI